ncbi:MAG: hypothetical protein QOD44_1030 [Solirubrobacteraceae bacterium]|jgi:hypothetical protein|nr:hypothetical protein [Solirubrobacteraceae bacterium]
MIRAVVAVLVSAAALLLAAPAGAVDPLILTSATPPDGAVIAPQPVGGIAWQIAGAPPAADVLVTVSTSSATAPDGVTLSDQDRVDFFFLSESATTPGAYTGASDPGPNAWSGAVGTYYWQVRATWTDAASVFHQAAGKIQRMFVGTAPPAGTPSGTPSGKPSGNPSGTPSTTGQSPASARTTLAMSALDATSYVRAVIRQRTRRQPSNLRYGCARVSTRSFRCRPSWRDSRNVYSATVTFTHTRAGKRIVAGGTFSGRRASRRCARTRTVASCGRSFRWHAVTPARRLTAARAR